MASSKAHRSLMSPERHVGRRVFTWSPLAFVMQSARRASLQSVAHTLHVGPGLALQAGIAKERRGMIRRNERNATVLEGAAPKRGHGRLRLQQSLRRRK